MLSRGKRRFRTNDQDIEDDLSADRDRKRVKRLHDLKLPDIISPEKLETIYADSADRLSNAYMSERVCCTCDCWHPSHQIVVKSALTSPALIEAMTKPLKPPPGLPQDLLSYYDVSAEFPKFSGVLLLPKGVCGSGNATKLQLCKPCYNSLMNKKLGHAPKFAIANGLYIGCMPGCFDDTDSTEHEMLNLAQPTKTLVVIKGGKHSFILAHVYYFRAEPSTPAALLPRQVVSDGTISVTMVGSMTPHQKTPQL